VACLRSRRVQAISVTSGNERVPSKRWEGTTPSSSRRATPLVGDGDPERLSGVNVTDDFLDALGVTPLVGRDFTEEDRALDVAPANEVYFLTSQVWAYYTLEMVVRLSLPAPVIAASVSEAIHLWAPTMATEDYRTLDSMVEESVSLLRFTLRILTWFALGALLLAGIGIYRVFSYSVTERIPEIGIRMALGESPAGVRRRLVSRVLDLALAGVASGAILALLCTRFVQSMLCEVEAADPLTFALTSAVILGVALVAGLVPAVRASRIDSARALRSA